MDLKCTLFHAKKNLQRMALRHSYKSFIVSQKPGDYDYRYEGYLGDLTMDSKEAEKLMSKRYEELTHLEKHITIEKNKYSNRAHRFAGAVAPEIEDITYLDLIILVTKGKLEFGGRIKMKGNKFEGTVDLD